MHHPEVALEAWMMCDDLQAGPMFVGWRRSNGTYGHALQPEGAWIDERGNAGQLRILDSGLITVLLTTLVYTIDPETFQPTLQSGWDDTHSLDEVLRAAGLAG